MNGVMQFTLRVTSPKAWIGRRPSSIRYFKQAHIGKSLSKSDRLSCGPKSKSWIPACAGMTSDGAAIDENDNGPETGPLSNQSLNYCVASRY